MNIRERLANKPIDTILADRLKKPKGKTAAQKLREYAAQLMLIADEIEKK